MFDQDICRTRTPALGGGDRSHHQEIYPVLIHRVGSCDVIHPWIELEDRPKSSHFRLCPLLYEFLAIREGNGIFQWYPQYHGEIRI